ncbi:DNA cytosine methyltransferase [Pseudomonas aeruginosa]|uniref:DNA cytosine methyltransferase n=1 Tax=Pseudomonas aeruginosa TaxID=287 RepID=UPI000DD4CF02|nr:DNA cytosine methyltransferase [Pseudomonas aeruginosa]EKU4265897.1 DNA cytosine methyltransferase [Pseudomonas aeruginosa]MCV6448630.1 DNA cytosine methyltransferase [Pseudomonas aeruginosa]MCV6467728.1 DNA cytosine methyltransferase [Pseudomonas aeruginosa]
MAIQQSPNTGLRELALFAGAGGGILGGHLLGWRTICAVERDAYAAQVLVQRQNDGALPAFPIWSDVCSFDGRPWRGLVDVVSGGFPCQDISAAGNGVGIDGERSGLWREMARIIGEVRPRFVFVENSPLLVRRGLAVVLGDLTELGYDARWCVMGAADIGAPHQRDRIWIVAYAECLQGVERRDITKIGRWTEQAKQIGLGRSPKPKGQSHWPVEPRMGRVADGVASRVDRLKALGNGQVPRVAATAFTYLASEWI